MLAGIVLLVLGLINFDTERGRAMLVAGMLLGSLGGLDTALREHFSGYRSHTTILAGLAAVALAAIAVLRPGAVAGGGGRRGGRLRARRVAVRAGVHAARRLTAASYAPRPCPSPSACSSEGCTT